MALVEQAPTPVQTETDRERLRREFREQEARELDAMETELDHLVFELDYISDQSQFVDDQITHITKRMARFSSYKGRHTQKYNTLKHMLEHYKTEMKELTERFKTIRPRKIELENILYVMR